MRLIEVNLLEFSGNIFIFWLSSGFGVSVLGCRLSMVGEIFLVRYYESDSVLYLVMMGFKFWGH